MITRDERRRIKIIRPATFSLLTAVRGLRDLVHYRDLVLTLTMHRISVRYKQSALGIGWAVLQPLLLMVVYTIIFSVVVKMPHEGGPYAVFVYAALLPWTFFSTAVTSSATSLVAHNSLITKVYFPREILPLTYVLAAFVDFLIASVILLALLGFYHVSLAASALLVGPIMLVAVLFSLAMAFLLSAFQVRFRDIGIAIGLLLQLWMYATPVVYPYSIVPDRFVFWYSLNPMAGVVENFRRVILQHATVNMAALWPGLIVCLLLLPLAYLYFKTAEATMADVI